MFKETLRKIKRKVQGKPYGRVIKEVDGFQMHLDIDDGGISNGLFHSGEREKAFVSILKETITDGMVCIDLGANIGHTTLLMLREVGESGFVYAVEPDPHNCQILQSNIKENKFENRCELNACAISDKSGTMDFWISSRPNVGGFRRPSSAVKSIPMITYDLGSFLKERRHPNFIKMDVEGHEPKILEGGFDYFSSNKLTTHFLIEVHPIWYNPDNDFAAILRKYYSIG